MDYIVNPLGNLIVWTFDNLLVPIGDLGAMNPNNLFIVLGFFGLFYWLRAQSKYNKQAEESGTLK
ncbi:MAG: hypothetical protein EA392_14075 [Cryomorphaceae bacterium]|nr:MAG: hypothetical protein EA392_14075 [Cryomorphaceae bacterium]